jgi:hypothetical protein
MKSLGVMIEEDELVVVVHYINLTINNLLNG